MPPPQATIEFPSLSGVVSAEMTFTTGAEPSVCTIVATPQESFAPQVGALRIRFGDVRLEFPGSAVDGASLSIGDEGNLWTLRLLDRRWRWKHAAVSGRYNIRLPDGRFDPEFPRLSARGLAEALLAALGETASDASALPAAAWPRADWDAADPARELARLCDDFACAVVLGLDDRVRIRRLGEGRPLPAGGAAMNLAYGLTGSVLPGAIKLIGGPLRFQTKLRLAAVGLDVDGAIKPIDRLSYTPAGGWSAGGIGSVGATYQREEEAQHAHWLATRSVYRWYRAAEQAGGGLQIPGLARRIRRIEQILPLEGTLLETALDPDGFQKPRPAEVEGTFLAGDDGRNTPPGTLYRGRFTLDRRRGIVRFPEPVVKLDGSGEIAPADLYLTTSYQVRTEPGGPPLRLEEERVLAGGGAKSGAAVLDHPELARVSRQTYRSVTRLHRRETNDAELAAEIDAYLQAAARRYSPRPSAEVQYAGLAAIEPDGAIRRITWRLGGDEPAVTRVWRNAT